MLIVVCVRVEIPSCWRFRFSWQTCRTILEEEGAVEVTWDCEEEDQDNSQQKLGWVRKPTTTTTTTAAAAAAKRRRAPMESSGQGRHSFFRSRKLQRMEAF